jgi:hypothetical protein
MISPKCAEYRAVGLKSHKSAAHFSAGYVLKCEGFCSDSRSPKSFLYQQCNEKPQCFSYPQMHTTHLIIHQECVKLFTEIMPFLNCFSVLQKKIQNSRGKGNKSRQSTKQIKTQELLAAG